MTISDNRSPFKADFAQAPYLVLWELTRACNLACRHCRARAIRHRSPEELSLENCRRLLDDLTQFGRPLLVLTGGDPVQRDDLFEIINEARQRGFPVAITPSATPITTRSVVERLKESGVERLAVSLDGPTALVHDRFRGVPGSYDMTLNIITWATAAQLPVQINTTIWNGNVGCFDQMVATVANLEAVLWSLFFLVPTGRAHVDMQISPQEAEAIMLSMAQLSTTAKFDVKATAAPHFRRVLIEYVSQMSPDADHNLGNLSPGMRLGALRAYRSVNDGKGVIFISHTGDIYPSGFLPLVSGNVKTASIVEVYRTHPLFLALRDASLLRGKCRACRYKSICGGSRARAYGQTQDYLAADPLCAYVDSNATAT
ncbi:MAG: TIGR04053 family radical SAM/SPASM domain-containing protein [Candidatus Obscuribacterales bacterium]